MADWFDEVLNTYARIAIAGGPKTGKTTLSKRVEDRPVYHTDDYRHMEWSEASFFVCELINQKRGPLIVEGVRVPHALRKGMIVDCVIWLDQPLEKLTERQRGMRNGCITVMDEVRPNLRAHWLFAPPAQLKAAIRSDR